MDNFESTQKQVLIAPYDTYKSDEPMHKEFISRIDFINRTGIFVSPLYYDTIYDAFKESGVAVDEFVRDYEAKYSNCIMEAPLTGTFKYEIQDDAVSCMGIYSEFHEPNVWEIINSLATAYFEEWKSKGETTRESIGLLDKMQKANEELISIYKQQELLNKEPNTMRQ